MEYVRNYRVPTREYRPMSRGNTGIRKPKRSREKTGAEMYDELMGRTAGDYELFRRFVDGFRYFDLATEETHRSKEASDGLECSGTYLGDTFFNEKVKKKPRCVACLDCVPNVTYLPCQHAVMCKECADLYAETNPAGLKCPLCNQNVVWSLQIRIG